MDLNKSKFIFISPIVLISAALFSFSGGGSKPVSHRNEIVLEYQSDDHQPEKISVEGKQLLVKIDTKTCRWSAELKGTDVKLHDIYFLEGDNPEGWTVTATVSQNDEGALGSFETVTLHGTQKGKLDFYYHISVSKTGNDIIVSLDRANHTGVPSEIKDMDYLVADNAQLGGTTDKWLTFGVHSRWEPYYKLTSVPNLKERNRYEVCFLARNSENSQTILMGHLTTLKGHSRFEIEQGNDPGSMRMRAWCNYNVTMPDNKSFAGEKLLLHLGNDALYGLEHLGDLIGIANKVNLREKRPLDLQDTSLISLTHCRWMGWSSGGTRENTARFIKQYGLDKFYYGVPGDSDPEHGAETFWGLYYCGGKGDYSRGTNYPDECYLPVKVPWGNGKVLDFSNPVAAAMERERARQVLAWNEKKVNWSHLDFAQDWDKWPNQHDPYMSALETWHTGASPWRDAVDSVAPRLRNRACISRPDFNYGYADLQRISRDADCGYVGGGTFLGDAVPSAATRFFYNTRVFWNDGDGFHIYRYIDPYVPPSMWRRVVPYNQAKVVASFMAITSSCRLVSEAFDQEYPQDRLELLKRISPPTADAAYPVDLFVREPAAVWNMPVERAFGKWNILAVFNYGPTSPDLCVTLDAKKDLRLDAEKEYIVYEFWSRKLIGTFKGKFTSREIGQKDCDIYSIVEKQDRPVLLSTSRQVRQMAFDIKDLTWSNAESELRGISRAVSGDPYQLRVYLPEGWRLSRVGMPTGLTTKTNIDGNLLLVDYTTSTDQDVEWRIFFSK